MTEDRRPSRRTPFFRVAGFWLGAGFTLLAIEALALFLPDVAVFGTIRVVARGQAAEALRESLETYPLIFLVTGLVLELVVRLFGRRIRLAGGASVHVVAALGLLAVDVGFGTLAWDHVMVGEAEITWLTAALMVLGGVAALLAALRLTNVRRTLGASHLIPVAVLAGVMLLGFPLGGDLVADPVAYAIFVLVGFAVAVGLLGLGLAASREDRPGPAAARIVWAMMGALALSAVGAAAWMVYEESRTTLLGEVTGDRPRMNVVLLVMDTARADRASCYGNERDTTPTLDALAAEGVRFERTMSASHWTTPSHASMFTGLHPGEHLATRVHKFLLNEHPTLAQILHRAGFRTAAFTANANVGMATGLNRGFEHFWQAGKRKRLQRYPTTWAKWKLFGLRKTDEERSRQVGSRHTPTAETVVDKVIGWLDDREPDGAPFFVFANFMDVHLPYVPPSHPDLDRYMPDAATYRRALADNQSERAYNAGEVEMTDEDFDLLLRLYDAQYRYLDDQIGRLCAHLRERGEWDDTLVIVTSDHGEFFGERNLMGHGAAAGIPTLAIPLVVVHLPGSAPGSTVSTLVQNLDLFPTVLDVLGLDWSRGDTLPGTSLRRPRASRSGHADAYASEQYWRKISDDPDRFADRFADTTIVIWEGDREMIWDSAGRQALYDILDDPRETTDLAPVEPDRASGLAEEAELLGRRSTGRPADGRDARFSPDDRDRLRGLGYLR